MALGKNIRSDAVGATLFSQGAASPPLGAAMGLESRCWTKMEVDAILSITWDSTVKKYKMSLVGDWFAECMCTSPSCDRALERLNNGTYRFTWCKTHRNDFECDSELHVDIETGKPYSMNNCFDSDGDDFDIYWYEDERCTVPPPDDENPYGGTCINVLSEKFNGWFSQIMGVHGFTTKQGNPFNLFNLNCEKRIRVDFPDPH